MKERPILFSGPMVRAILEGRKTQTRRVVRRSKAPQNDMLTAPNWAGPGEAVFLDPANPTRPMLICCCPYGVTGDRLWVRETLRFEEGASSVVHGYEMRDPGRLVYAADGAEVIVPNEEAEAWCCKQTRETIPAIHMPRWACRLVPEVVSVRVERVQDISEKDIIAEGAVLRPHEFDGLGKCPVSAFDGGCYVDLRSLWCAGWCGINGKESWSRNDWVWVIEFKKVS